MSDNNPYATPRAEITEAGESAGTMASRPSRLRASLIDSAVVTLTLCICVFLPAFFAVRSGYLDDSVRLLAAQGVLKFFLPLLWGAIFVILFFMLNWRLLRQGQTIGKKRIGIRMVTAAGEVPGMGALCRRYLFLYMIGHLPFIGGLLSLANILCIFRDSHMCLHDSVAGTRVVNA